MHALSRHDPHPVQIQDLAVNVLGVSRPVDLAADGSEIGAGPVAADGDLRSCTVDTTADIALEYHPNGEEVLHRLLL